MQEKSTAGSTRRKEGNPAFIMDAFCRYVLYVLRMIKKAISGGPAHKLPPDLRDALASDSAALAAWEDLTPLARNEWICWVTFVKKDETRGEHVRRTIGELKEGVRRPCCWMGCIHRKDKPVSPSVRALLDRRSKISRKNKA